jgi:hypothetical protein
MRNGIAALPAATTMCAKILQDPRGCRAKIKAGANAYLLLSAQLGFPGFFIAAGLAVGKSSLVSAVYVRWQSLAGREMSSYSLRSITRGSICVEHRAGM